MLTGGSMRMKRMRLLPIASAILMLVLFDGVLIADDISDKMKLSGEIRARIEGDNRDFNADTKLTSFGLLRTRLNLDFYPDSPVRAFVQIQDSRVKGAPGLGSSSLDNDTNLGLHQAYVLVKCDKNNEIYAKIGRFEYAKGNQRVFGSVGWSNVGRTWDGAIVGYQADQVNIQLFGLVRNERLVLLNDDVYVVGTYVEVEDPDIDFFILWDRDNQRDDANNPAISRLTAGLYRRGEFSQLDYTTNLAYQFGSIVFDTLDVSAFLATLEIGYTFETEKHLRLAAGIDITSGDDDASDDKHKEYSNLYYTGHKFRGHMDFFIGSPQMGLNDIYMAATFKPREECTLNAHLHRFTSNVDYASVVDGSAKKSLGTEIDISAKRQVYDRFQIGLGASGFFPSDDWKGLDSDPSWWFYLQTTATF